MKNIILILFLTLNANNYAQITGKTQTGNLLIKKNPNIEAITGPQIILTEPKLSDNNLLKVETKNLAIKGYVIDKYGLEEIIINNIKIFPTDNNNPLPSPKPRGADWIEAYRHWAKRSG